MGQQITKAWRREATQDFEITLEDGTKHIITDEQLRQHQWYQQ